MPMPNVSRRSTKSLLSSVLVLVVAGIGYIAKQRGWVASPQAQTSTTTNRRDEPVATDARDDDPIAELVRLQRSDAVVETSGTVAKVLPDDKDGDRHQRFLVRVGRNTVLVAHNIDLAPRVPVREGDAIRLKGEFEYNDRGGVIHWTHHSTGRNHASGWIEVGGKRYE
jgi:hypothetical protein